MTTAGDLYRFIDSFAPFRTALSFDNAGFLVGDQEATLQKVLLALDITNEVIEEAREMKVQLIVSHHPIIFQPLSRISVGSAPYALVQAGISAVCAHTNLDLAPEGVNTALAAALSLHEVRPLRLHHPECGGEPLPYGVSGSLGSTLEPQLFAQYVKQVLSCEGVRWLEGNKPVKTVALCSGAGGDMVFEAAQKGIDAFVTGEMKHHEWLAAREASITVVDAGHFKTEVVVLEPLAQKLSNEFPDVTFAISTRDSDGVQYL